VLIRLAHNSYRFLRISHPMVTDGLAAQILDTELAIAYEAKLHRREPPLPIEAPLQYADYAAWQRQVMQPNGRYFNEVMNWWKSRLSTVQPSLQYPSRRMTSRAHLDPSAGVLRWQLDDRVARRLDEIVRGCGATHFTIRLAIFAALVADMTDQSTIVIGASLSNRNRLETQDIVGPFRAAVHLIFDFDPDKTFLEWLALVRDRVFEARAYSELPSDIFRDQLRASGFELPDMHFYFNMSRDHSDQHFGNMTLTSEFWDVGAMPRGCAVFLDEQRPENCRINFDANRFDRNEMNALLSQYLRLLEVVACAPDLTVSLSELLIDMRWDAAMTDLLAADDETFAS